MNTLKIFFVQKCIDNNYLLVSRLRIAPYIVYRNVIFILALTLVMSSCVPVKDLRYFNNKNEMEQPVSNARTQKRIMPFDNLYIRVLSTDEKTAQIFNATEPFRNDVSPNLISYLVDENGNINFPFAGQIAVSGLTTTDASEKIQKALSEYIANTDVIVKYIDNKVTVLGEVQKQGVYNFSSDKLNVYDAIALAGGMTKYGNHKKVVLVRQENKNIMHYNLDLSTSDISATKYYFINPNDVLVVEPLWHISTSYENTTYTTLLTTITTLVTLLYFFRQR